MLFLAPVLGLDGGPELGVDAGDGGLAAVKHGCLPEERGVVLDDDHTRALALVGAQDVRCNTALTWRETTIRQC